MAIKSTKLVAEMLRQRERERQWEQFLSQTHREGPNAIAATAGSTTVIEYWDGETDVVAGSSASPAVELR